MTAAAPQARAPVGQHPNPRFGLRIPAAALAAVALAVVMIVSWALKDWAALRLMRLPDNDDMMRLAEVRDWLGGQGFNDLLQHRLGPPEGASMHWSRIADAIPALIILLLAPLLGQNGAETAMLLLYPGLLFAAYMLLASRIAGRLGGKEARLFAVILAALAFPTISLFVPGRIDHHALQIVLTMVLLDSLVARPSVSQGAIAGVSAALSLAVGLEAAPEILAAMIALGLLWLVGDQEVNRRGLGFGAALGGVTLMLYLFARPHVWPEAWCDGFTPASTRATFTLAAAWLLLGSAGFVLRSWRARLVFAALVGCGAGLIALRSSSVCFNGPYDALTPFLKQVWMSNVSEAGDLFVGQDTIGTSVAYGMLVLCGCALSLFQLRRRGVADRPWLAFAVFLLLGTLASIAQVRVTYIVAGVASIPFAVALGHSRDAGLARRLGFWVLGAGITWNLVGAQMDSAFAKPIEHARVAAKACTAGEPILEVAALPAGNIMAPIDLGSYLIGMTHHHVFAAGYHRNNAGNMAMYRFFLAKPEQARALARAWRVDYVALCPENLSEVALEPYRPGSLAERLQAGGSPPGWLEPVPTGGSLMLYRVH